MPESSASFNLELKVELKVNVHKFLNYFRDLWNDNQLHKKLITYTKNLPEYHNFQEVQKFFQKSLLFDDFGLWPLADPKQNACAFRNCYENG